MCDDNRNRLFCLNSQLQPCGEAFTQQPVQSSSIAWRALCRAAPCLCKSRRPQHSAQRLWASDTSRAAGKRCGSPTCTLLLSPTALDCVGLVWALPRRTAPCSCTQCGGFKTSNGFELPKGQDQVLENEDMKNIFFWNHRPRWLVALCKRESLSGSPLSYGGRTGMEMLRVQE